MKGFIQRHVWLSVVVGLILGAVLAGGSVIAATSAWTTPIISPPIAISPTGTITVLPVPILPTTTIPKVSFSLPANNLNMTITDGQAYSQDFNVIVSNISTVGTDGLDPNYHSITINSCTGLPAGWTCIGSWTSPEGCAPGSFEYMHMTITSPVLHIADSGLVINPVIYLAVQ